MYLRDVGGTMVQSVRLYQMFIRNGTCVSSTVKTSAGSSGRRRCQGRRSSSCLGAVPSAAPGSCRTVSTCISADQPPTWDATSWHALSAASMLVCPAMTLENCSVQRLPTSWNSGMPTYCTPGRPGLGVVPGLSIGAASIDSRVASAKAPAASWYSEISYVEALVPGGIAAHPPATCSPAALM